MPPVKLEVVDNSLYVMGRDMSEKEEQKKERYEK